MLALLYGGYYLYSILGLPFEAQVNGFFIIAVLFLLIADSPGSHRHATGPAAR